MESATDRAIAIVQYCLRKAFCSVAGWDSYGFRQESYSRWAAREILYRLENDRNTPPLIIIENFRNQMDEYACMNSCTSYMFSVAKDMAQWIVDLLIS